MRPFVYELVAHGKGGYKQLQAKTQKYPAAPALPLPDAADFFEFMPESEYKVLRSEAPVCGESNLEVYVHNSLYEDTLQKAHEQQTAETTISFRPEAHETENALPTQARWRVGFRLMPASAEPIAADQIARVGGFSFLRKKHIVRMGLKSPVKPLHSDVYCVAAVEPVGSKYDEDRLMKSELPLSPHCLASAADGGLRTNTCLVDAAKLRLAEVPSSNTPEGDAKKKFQWSIAYIPAHPTEPQRVALV